MVDVENTKKQSENVTFTMYQYDQTVFPSYILSAFFFKITQFLQYLVHGSIENKFPLQRSSKVYVWENKCEIKTVLLGFYDRHYLWG